MEKTDEKKYIVFSDVRAFRNVDGVNFVSKFSADDADDIVLNVKKALDPLYGENNYGIVDLNKAEKDQIIALSEAHSLRIKVVPQKYPRFVFYDNTDQTLIMTNEAEHIAVATSMSGFELDSCYSATAKVVNELSSRIPFANDEGFGFITSDPGLSGASLKAAVVMHIPALTISPEFSPFFEKMAKKGISVKGLYSEANKTFGAYWRISNDYMRGITEDEIISEVKSAVNYAAELEEEKRSELIGKKRQFLYDTVWRSFGVLATSRLLSNKDFIIAMSNLRLGAELDMFDISLDTIDEITTYGRQSYISRYAALHSLSVGQSNDYVRARIIREVIAPYLKQAL